MKNVAAKIQFTDLPTRYEELVQLHPPRTLHDAVDLKNSTQYIDAMAGHDLNQDQQDYLDVISTLVAEYEEAEAASPIIPPLDALNALLEENGMNASDLGRLLGNRELGSKILRGERRLNVHHIQKLAARFAVSPALFIPRNS